jgi:hypothetical protein
MDWMGVGLNASEAAGAWPEQVAAGGWTQAIADAMAWASIAALLLLVPLLVLFTQAVRRRQFWCVGRHREVEVEFEERGLPGLRRAVAVRSCSAFEPPTAVTCRRGCLDRDRQCLCEPLLPGHGIGANSPEAV